MYAWSYIAVGGKWPDADVYDSTCDQVYNPSVSYTSTNNAVDFTWNWRLLRSDGLHLFRTFYRAYESQCEDAGLTGYCMGQYESRDMAYDLYTWDEILAVFYTGSELTEVYVPPGGHSLRYYGNGYGDLDRVKVAIDDPTTTEPGPPSDVGSTDFTLEWWMKASAGENPAVLPACGADDSWRRGNVIIDRDRFNQNGDYGVSLGGGRIAFGVTGSDGTQLTLCGTTSLADGIWHHVAVQRRISDGWMSIYVDGVLDAEADGPDGDISYPDDGTPLSVCGTGGTSTCSNDPYLVFGAEKHDQERATYLSFHGWLDETRLSNVLRYSAAFTRPASPFSTDGDTVGLWHFDEGYGNVIYDHSVLNGPSLGDRNYGGVTNGPEWTDDTYWYVPPPTPTPTPTLSPTPEPAGETTWYLAEGYSADGFGTFILIQNPNALASTVDVTYMLQGGGTLSRQHSVPANSRYTIVAQDAAEVGMDQAFSTLLVGSQSRSSSSAPCTSAPTAMTPSASPLLPPPGTSPRATPALASAPTS